MTFWSPKEIEIAINLSEQGKSFSQIAEMLHGKTRNSVAGKLKRLGIHQQPRTKRQRQLAYFSTRAPYQSHEAKNLNHLEDIQDFFSPETFGKGF